MPDDVKTLGTNKRSLVVDGFTNSVLDPIEPMLGPIENGGTTLKDHRTGLDEKGKFQNNLSVYGQDNCQVCDTKIEKITQSQRTTYYCPNCQKL